jgi:hypothetical protein
MPNTPIQHLPASVPGRVLPASPVPRGCRLAQKPLGIDRPGANRGRGARRISRTSSAGSCERRQIAHGQRSGSRIDAEDRSLYTVPVESRTAGSASCCPEISVNNRSGSPQPSLDIDAISSPALQDLTVLAVFCIVFE